MINKIYDKLKKDNLNPYFIGQYEGLCQEPYVIVKRGTQIPSIQSSRLGQVIVDVIIYIPKRSYVELDPYMDKIRTSLKDLRYLKKTGVETPAITDSDKEAYTSSIEYVLQKKLEG